tara:strand:+ start:2913 stop:3806 length:894 start_codon:yes stop_codon:yes gene_type:complete
MELIAHNTALSETFKDHWTEWKTHYGSEAKTLEAVQEVLKEMDDLNMALTEQGQSRGDGRDWGYNKCNTTTQQEINDNNNLLDAVFEKAGGKRGGLEARNAVNLEIAVINMKYNMNQDKAREELEKKGPTTFEKPPDWDTWEPSEKLAEILKEEAREEEAQQRREEQQRRAEQQRQADEMHRKTLKSLSRRGGEAEQRRVAARGDRTATRASRTGFQANAEPPRALNWGQRGESGAWHGSATYLPSPIRSDPTADRRSQGAHGGGGGKKNRRRKSTKGKKKRRRSKKKKQSKRRRRT